MLKSTHQPAESGLPAGWTAHKAPSGHTYYYHAESKKSTYIRPAVEPVEPPQTVIPSYSGGQFAPGFNQASFTPQFQVDHNSHPGTTRDGWQGGKAGAYGERSEDFQRRRNERPDRPKHKYKIPNCAPWVLVKTKLGRRFVHNTESGESFWKIPADVMSGVVEFERREREKKERRARGEKSEDEEDNQDLLDAQKKELEEEDESSEYMEVEVTDDEEEGEEDGPSKRQKTEELASNQPMEFNEDDLAAELEDMEGEYDSEDAEGQLTEEDCRILFFELLDDSKISPFSTWDKLIEDDRVIDDERYVALPNMRSRRAAWDEWSRNKIQRLKDAKATQEKKDPRIPYFSLLQEHASTKLYWPEFKRKYRKEPAMKDSKVPDKDREKWYREYVKRLGFPQSTLKSEFVGLLKSLPTIALNRDTPMENLPMELLTDLKYVSLQPSIRDPMLETYISTLPPAPDPSAAMEESLQHKKQADRKRRERALAAREKKVDEDKRAQEQQLRHAKARLRAGEMELERAMHVGRDGLKSQLSHLDKGLEP